MPAALRGAVVVDFGAVVDVVVTSGGGEALTRGAFSHGGHGAWYSPLPLGGDGGGDTYGPRVVGVLRFCGDGGGDGADADGGDGERDMAWNDPAPPTG